MANVEIEVLLNGTIVDRGQGTAPASYSTANILLGELSGSTYLPPASYRFDDTSCIAGGVERLSNRGFESALATAGSGLSSGNWRPYPQFGIVVDQVSDIVRSGSYSGRFARPASNSSGGYHHQYVTLTSANFDLSAWVYRDAATASDGRASMAILFGWTGPGSSFDEVSITQQPGGDWDWTGYGAGGVSVASPADNTWNKWQIRVYPEGKPEASRHMGLVRVVGDGAGNCGAGNSCGSR